MAKLIQNVRSTYDLTFACLLSVLLALHCLLFLKTPAQAQVIGEQAEMQRLEHQANDLIANGDPHGAAQSIGKAAMMAGILAKQEADQNLKVMFTGVEALFRTQENGYRAIALFEQAGGQPPAPKGACQLLKLAQQHGKATQKHFSKVQLSNQSESNLTVQDYLPKSKEWIDIIQELWADFDC